MLGVIVIPVSNAGFTVRIAVNVLPPSVAVMVAVEVDVTAAVLTVKFAVVAPAATKTLAGTWAFELLDDN